MIGLHFVVRSSAPRRVPNANDRMMANRCSFTVALPYPEPLNGPTGANRGYDKLHLGAVFECN